MASEPKAAWARVTTFDLGPNRLGYGEAQEASPVIVFATASERDAGLARLLSNTKETSDANE